MLRYISKIWTNKLKICQNDLLLGWFMKPTAMLGSDWAQYSSYMLLFWANYGYFEFCS